MYQDYSFDEPEWKWSPLQRLCQSLLEKIQKNNKVSAAHHQKRVASSKNGADATRDKENIFRPPVSALCVFSWFVLMWERNPAKADYACIKFLKIAVFFYYNTTFLQVEMATESAYKTF